MTENIVELFTIPTQTEAVPWGHIIAEQYCPLIERKCIKIRKSAPNIAIGTCTVRHGVHDPRNIVICPQRFLDRGQVFLDCLHLLTLHEPGNELHKVPEIEIPGGSVDYFLASVQPTFRTLSG